MWNQIISQSAGQYRRICPTEVLEVDYVAQIHSQDKFNQFYRGQRGAQVDPTYHIILAVAAIVAIAVILNIQLAWPQLANPAPTDSPD